MDTAATPAPPAHEPAPSNNRLLAIDVTRGFALLGIFFVNIQTFAEPFGRFVAPRPESDDFWTQACFFLVKIFCEGKFYPLFSLLFGMGLALQMQSVIARGQNFYGLYSRRLAWLFFMGLTHALLLWYGDILFIYSFAGLALMFCVRINPHVLLSIGAGLIILVSIVSGALGAMNGLFAGAQREAIAETAAAADSPQAEQASEPAPPEEPLTPFRQVIRGMQLGPESPDWLKGETRAYRDGPWTQLFLVRAMSWGMYLAFCLFGFAWHVLGMFFIGAALLRLGLFSEVGNRWQVRLLLIGLFVGLPGAVIAATIQAKVGVTWWTAGLSGALLMLCGPLVSLMYLCTFALLVRHGIAKPLTFVLSNVGRMALTNYLSQTVISTFVFYYWGLAQFGSWSRPERCAFVLGIFACQCIISVLWMRAFRIGPMEWVWRSVTYLKPQPILRTRDNSESV
jgi:uncharacterized protein